MKGNPLPVKLFTVDVVDVDVELEDQQPYMNPK